MRGRHKDSTLLISRQLGKESHLTSQAKAESPLCIDPLTRLMEAAWYYGNRAGIFAVLNYFNSVFCLNRTLLIMAVPSIRNV